MADNFRGGGVGDEEVRKFDVELHAVTTSDAMHRLIHDGMVFHASGKILDVANGASVAILWTVPPDGLPPHVHNVNMSYSRGDIDTRAYRNPTVTDPGTPIPVFNVNQLSDKTPTLLLARAPTTSDFGEQIHIKWAPPTAKKVGDWFSIVGSVDNERWMLKPGEQYLFRLTNNSGETIDLAYELSWFEISYEN